MTQRRLLFMVLAPLALVPILLWSGQFLGKRVAFGLVVLLAVTSSVGLTAWMRKVSRRRVALMGRLGFTPAPDAAAALSRNTRLGKLVTQTLWTVLPNRAFQGTHHGVAVTYFDAHKNYGNDLYNAATVVGAHLLELQQARTSEPGRAAAAAHRLTVIESKGSLFCFRPDHMVPDDAHAIADFLQEAVAVLISEAGRRRASR